MIGITPPSVTLIGRWVELTAVHLTAYNTLCILDRDTSLCVLHKGDEPNNSKEQYNKQRNQYIELGAALRAELPVLAQKVDGVRQSCDDTREQQDRDTVTDTVFVDLLTQPHDQRSTCGECEDDNDRGKPHREARCILCQRQVGGGPVSACGSLSIVGILQEEVIRGTLDQT